MKNYIFIATFFMAFIGFAQTTIMEVDSFSKIKIDADAQVEIVYSPKDQVIFNVNEDQLKNFTISSDNGSLSIQQNGTAISGLKIRIYTNQLKGMAVNGSGNVTLTKFNSMQSLYLSMKGSYTVNTGTAKIKNFTISRDANSKAIHENTVEVKESVNGSLLVTN
ncbi:hypothetical protein BBFL7_00830 [Flavobacteria bacterium BBFL7]|nr:hypothetical protein BBFL7_00830 [Flavobacteria bacterium BBFL7]